MKILTVIGARPQFIKAAAVSHVLQKRGIKEILLHTGQHFDNHMSQIFFDELQIPLPKYQLDINSLSHGAMTGRMLESIEKVLLDEKPAAVMVYGDTNSTLAGALAAAKLHIPVAHVEAGLRSFNRNMPEELNRIVTDHLSSLLFAPSETAVRLLKSEGIDGQKVQNTGDVMLDAVHLFRPLSLRRKSLSPVAENYVLLTFHREENTSDELRIRSIVSAINQVADSHPVVFPVHPRTKKVLDGAAIRLHQNVHVSEPVGYLEMLQLEAKAAVIVTDSGGVQKEAYFNRVPCVTIRSETEWTELVEHGWNVLVDPSNQDAIATSVRKAIGSKGQEVALFGDGHAAEKIANALTGLQ